MCRSNRRSGSDSTCSSAARSHSASANGAGREDRRGLGGEDVVEHRADQVVLAPDRRVEGHRRQSELAREAAHRHHGQAVGVGQVDGEGDDGLAVRGGACGATGGSAADRS
jgi:hypothetical protein